MNPMVSTLIKGMLYFILKAKQGGKYLSRKQVIDKRTGRKTWKYKYKPMQQRAAHEVTRGKFEKVTKLSGDEHKNQIEHALQNGIHVSLHVLRDYPDLAVKYHQQARLAKADKIRAKVKASKEKERIEREVRLNTPEGLKNNPIKLEAERMMKEERKQAPAFKLEQEDITSKEKNTRFNDAQGGLFGKKPVTHESYAKKDFKPSLALEGNKTITSLVTAVKSALMREGLDTKAREFVDKAFKEKDISSLKKLASEYVDMKESSQVSNPSTENKGSEEKKMFSDETLEKEYNDNDVWDWNGSEKQIAWAEKIKKEKMDKIKSILSGHTPEYKQSTRGETYQDQLLNLRKNWETLASFNNAKFWITFKDQSPEEFGRILFTTEKDEDGAISVSSYKNAYPDEIERNIQDLKSQFKKS